MQMRGDSDPIQGSPAENPWRMGHVGLGGGRGGSGLSSTPSIVVHIHLLFAPPSNNYFASSIIINLIVIGTPINIAASITIRTYCTSYLISAVDFTIHHRHNRPPRPSSIISTTFHEHRLPI
eukprot:scaffold22856_cov50-Cyclotella_meneghiniana.AAC.6